MTKDQKTIKNWGAKTEINNLMKAMDEKKSREQTKEMEKIIQSFEHGQNQRSENSN